MSELLNGYLQASSGALLTDRCARAASIKSPEAFAARGQKSKTASAVWKSNKGACSVSTQRSEGGSDS